MKLEHTNLNGDIVLIRDVNLEEISFIKIEKIEMKDESYIELLFQKDAVIA